MSTARISAILFILILAAVGLWAENPSPKPLEAQDRILMRESQLELAQAHIARLQAEAQVRVAEDRLIQLVQGLKTRYACPDCQLNNDFTWTPAPKVEPPKAEDPQSAAPAPEKASGQNSKKE